MNPLNYGWKTMKPQSLLILLCCLKISNLLRQKSFNLSSVLVEVSLRVEPKGVIVTVLDFPVTFFCACQGDVLCSNEQIKHT